MSGYVSKRKKERRELYDRLSNLTSREKRELQVAITKALREVEEDMEKWREQTHMQPEDWNRRMTI